MLDYWNMRVDIASDNDVPWAIQVLSNELVRVLRKDRVLDEEMEKLTQLANAYRSHKTINWLLELYDHLKLVQWLTRPYNSRQIVAKARIALISEYLKLEMISMVIYFLETLQVSRTSLIHTRTFWSILFDLNIGNFIRAWAIRRNYDENQDAVKYLTKSIPHKDMLQMISNVSTQEDVYAILKPYLKKYLQAKLREAISQIEMPDNSVFDTVKEVAQESFPNAKAQFINPKQHIDSFLSYFVETIDDEQVLRFSNRVSDVIMIYVNLLKRYTWDLWKQKLLKYFIEYCGDELAKKYQQSHVDRSWRTATTKQSSVWKKSAQFYPTVKNPSSFPDTKYRVQIPSEVINLINKMSNRAVGQEEDCKRYLTRMWKKNQSIKINWLVTYYNVRIEQGMIDLLKESGFKFYEVHLLDAESWEIGPVIENDDNNSLLPPKPNSPEQSLALLLTWEHLDPKKVVAYYKSLGHVIYNEKWLIEWLVQFTQDQWEKGKASSYNRLLKWAKPEYRKNGYWHSKKDWRHVMKLWSYRFVKYKHVLVAVRDHNTYDDKLWKRWTLSRKLIDDVSKFLDEQEKGVE